MPYADVQGARLYYERRGSGDPLLFVTGRTISAAVFEPVLDLYAQHFDCIIYDHRGSARSSGTSPTTMGALADDAAGMLKRLGVPRAHVCGLSMGGAVAQELALRHPGRVHGLILGGTSSGGLFGPRLGLRDVLAITRGALSERTLRAPLLFSPEFRREHPERVRELVRYFTAHRSSPATIAAQTGASARGDAPAPRAPQGADARDARRVRPARAAGGQPPARLPHPRRRAGGPRRQRPRLHPRASARVARRPAELARAPAVPSRSREEPPCGA